MRCIHSDKPSLSRLAAALFMPFAALALQWLLWDYFKPYAWFLFFPAVFFSVWIGGWVGGIAATLLSALLVWHFFMPLITYLESEGFPSPFSVIVFVLMGGLLAFFHDRVTRSDRSAARLRLLAGTIEKIAAVRDLPSLMSIVRHSLRELTGADGITLVLRDNDHCHYVDEDAIGPLWKGQRFPLESCISGWTMLHAEAAAIEDIYADSRIPHEAYRPTFVKSLSMVPIGREQPVGAIGCYWARQHRASPEELELQQALADAMSVGLTNIDLFQHLETSRQAAEESATQARESQERLQLVLDATNDGLWDWDLRSGVVYRSPRYYELIGYPPETALGDFDFFRKLVHPHDLERVLGIIDAHRQGRTKAIEYDFRLITASGVERWMAVKGRAVERDAQGMALRIVGMLMDIGLRKAAEAALQESQERLQLLIDHAPAALAMFDRDMRYLAVSRRWIDDYSLDTRDLLGHAHYETFPEITEAWKEAHRRGLAGEIVRVDEDRFERADAAVQWLRWEVRPWHTAEGAVGGIVIFSEDITERVSSQQEILQLNASLEQRVAERTAELSLANQELDAFAYAVSHDLRAPLRAMLGFSQALLEDFGDKFEGEARSYLDQIGIASHKMENLIEGILALSRSTRGELRHERIDLSALSAGIAAELQRSAPERQVAIDIEPGLTASGDPRMIEAMLRNLLGNAWKYSGKVAAPRIRVYSGEVDGLRGICVADNGAGFDMAHAGQLFQPFRRLHREDEFPGIGIGLATVQRIVHRHGGEIRVQAAPDAGATFCFTLTGKSDES